MKVESRKLACYKRLMAKKDQLLGAMISTETLDEILKMCDKEERSKSWIAAAMIERGLAAYRRDGLLKEPLTPLKASPVRKADSALGVPHKQKQAGNNRVK